MRKIIFAVFLLADVTHSKAHEMRVAVAANAYSVVRLIHKQFTLSTGIEVEVISGSSGKLAAQAKHGARYQLSLPADMDFPGTLHKEGHTTGAPQVYALGSLVVCSTTGMDVKAWRCLITTGKLGKVAIANPSLAPYGKAAQQALTKCGLWDKM